MKSQKRLKLFTPGYIGTLELKNRVIMPAMGTNFGTPSGSTTERMVDYYAERARGGVGLIIVEATTVEFPRGKVGPVTLSIHDDALLPAHNWLVETVHRAGARIALQIFHAGLRANPKFSGGQPVAPSAIPCKVLKIVPRDLSRREIEDLIETFVKAAERAKKSGYDAIELHGAHGHLINQFISPYFNRRSDSFGGSFAERMRFAREIVKKVRERLEDYPIIFRVSGDEFVEGGIGLEEAVQVARTMEEVGISAVHVTAGIAESYAKAIEPMGYGQGWKVYMAARMKEAVKVPVITVGVIRDPRFAEAVLRQNQADFVAVGRGLIADPEWPRKALEGREKEIRPCISCNFCYGRLENGLPLRCALNPDVGFEREAARSRPAGKRKKVMVIGGGPAGLSAAIEARRRGHAVYLYEREKKLGGQLHLAGAIPGKEKIAGLLDYFIRQVRALRIPAKTGWKMEPRRKKEEPDVIVLATGAKPAIPPLPLQNQKIRIFTAWEALKSAAFSRKEDIVILGGYSLGCETALFLAAKGNRITLVSRSQQIAANTDRLSRESLLEKLDGMGVRILTDHDVLAITDDGVEILGPDRTLRFLRADKIVSARLVIAEDRLKVLSREVKEFYQIGDCKEPRQIADAICEGVMAGRMI